MTNPRVDLPTGVWLAGDYGGLSRKAPAEQTLQGLLADQVPQLIIPGRKYRVTLQLEELPADYEDRPHFDLGALVIPRQVTKLEGLVQRLGLEQSLGRVQGVDGDKVLVHFEAFQGGARTKAYAPESLTTLPLRREGPIPYQLRYGQMVAVFPNSWQARLDSPFCDLGALRGVDRETLIRRIDWTSRERVELVGDFWRWDANTDLFPLER